MRNDMKCGLLGCFAVLLLLAGQAEARVVPGVD